MFRLTDYFEDDSFNFQGREIFVDMTFDNILRLFEMFEDPEFEEWEKPIIALRMLLGQFDELSFEEYEEMFQLFKYLMKEFVEIDLNDHEDIQAENSDGQEDEQQSKPTKIMDYVKDAELIYASFFAVYKMDLTEMQGKLHWKKFKALLAHLDDNSPFKQVIGYRTMKVPSEKESSKEYRAHVQKMKRQYALEQPDDTGNPDKVFDSLSKMFKAQAKKGG